MAVKRNGRLYDLHKREVNGVINFNNKRNRKILSAIIIVIVLLLIIAMIMPMMLVRV